MAEIENELAAIKGRWMSGLAGSDAASANWKTLIGSGTEAELRLLALTGQALQIGFVPVPSDKLQPSRPLPELSLPVMPQAARHSFRRAMADNAQDTQITMQILELVESRGYSAHPFDWMPRSSHSSDVPALYAPWTDWLNNDVGKPQQETLSEENWDGWFPAERRSAFTALRTIDPDAARELLAAKALDVPADERLRLIDLLSNRLGESDIAYLESLEKDRSGKVKTRAAQLLARLGACASDAELVAELAETLELKRAKLLSSAKAVIPKKLKNNAQRKRRLELFSLVPLHALANAFELTSLQFVEGWDLATDERCNHAFISMVANTGDDTVPAVLASRIVALKDDQYALYELIPRLPGTVKQQLIGDALAIEGDLFQLAVDLSRPALGQLKLESINKSPDYKAMTTAIAEIAKGATNRKTEIALAHCYTTLGLLLDKKGADAAIAQVIASGTLASDPQLNMLQLNAALTPSSRSIK